MADPLRHRQTKGAATDMVRPNATALHPNSTRTEPIPTGIANGRCGGMNTSSSDQGGTPEVAFDNGPLQDSAVASQDCPAAAVRGTHRSPVLRATMRVAGGKCVARTPWISIGTPSLSSSTETRAKSLPARIGVTERTVIDFPAIRTPMDELRRENSTKPRAADDFATIRARIVGSSTSTALQHLDPEQAAYRGRMGASRRRLRWPICDLLLTGPGLSFAEVPRSRSMLDGRAIGVVPSSVGRHAQQGDPSSNSPTKSPSSRVPHPEWERRRRASSRARAPRW